MQTDTMTQAMLAMSMVFRRKVSIHETIPLKEGQPTTYDTRLVVGFDCTKNILKDFQRICVGIEKMVETEEDKALFYRERSSGTEGYAEQACFYTVAAAWMKYQ